MAKETKSLGKVFGTIIGYYFCFAGPQVFLLLLILSHACGWSSGFGGFLSGWWQWIIFFFYIVACSVFAAKILFDNDLEKNIVTHEEVEIKYDSDHDKYTARKYSVDTDLNENKNNWKVIGIALLIAVGGVIIFIVKTIMLLVYYSEY